MRIVCVSAFKAESSWLLGRLQNAVRLALPGVRLWQGSLSGHEVQVLVCGAGPDRARAALERYRPYCRAEKAYHLGVCGTLDDGLPLYSVVAAESVSASYRSEVPPIWLEVPDAQFFPGEEEILLRRGSFVTHRQQVFSGRVKLRLLQRFGATCVDMESWEVAAFSRDLNLPLSVIKAVSDGADEMSVAGYAPRARNASRLAARAVCELIRTL